MPAPRCPACKLHVPLCICAVLPRLDTQTRLLLVVHRKETQRPSNTGMVAAQCLQKADVWIRGDRQSGNLDYGSLAGGEYTNLLLYPSDEAVVLSADFLSKIKRPLRLIVPDGNWGQASRTASRIRAALPVQTVILPQGAPTSYRLRKELHKDGLATFEAIARAFGILESTSIQEKMEHAFRLLVERNLYMRGKLAKHEVYGGIP